MFKSNFKYHCSLCGKFMNFEGFQQVTSFSDEKLSEYIAGEFVCRCGNTQFIHEDEIYEKV